MTSGSTSVRPSRSRAATRAALLDAARVRFQDHGFDGASVRDIAGDVGVDAALVNRYFGSKEGLFTEIAPTDTSVTDLLGDDRSTVGLRLANTLLSKDATSDIQIVLRSLGSNSVARRYESELHDRYVVPLAQWLGGRDALVRAGLIVSLLNGVALSLTVLEQRSLSVNKRRTLVKHMAGALQAVVDG
jgi:Tetracyclin repressor-like, C-terminal domain/Bacterial regulatory proteins, tetR family